MAVSKAHIKASNKYNKANYKQLKANIKPEDYAMIDDYCNKSGVSKAQLIVTACKEYIEKISHDSSNVPMPDEIEALKETQSETEFISGEY